MPTFRKKPVVVRAEKFVGPQSLRAGEELPPTAEGVQWTLSAEHSGKRWPYVVTAHGQMVMLVTGDWVIAEPDNRGYYPCKPDIFEATYDPA